LISGIALASSIGVISSLENASTAALASSSEDKGTVNEPIGRSPKDRKRMAVVYKNSRNAITHYEVLKRFGNFTHIKCILETGRTHQIRVHMAYLGHPLAGDSIYGPKKVITKLSGQCLHAGEIGFVHPRTNEYLHFTSPLPDYFTDFLAELERKQ
jgi:23S rRNA pseudouridine1911/1915/1917 synthase